MAPIIALSKVSKIHQQPGMPRVTALHDIDLDIEKGEFVSIMGPSGSGKSTFLNLVSALDIPTSGTIHIEGQDISTLGDDELTLFRRTKVGLVFQFFNLLPTLNALDNVMLPIQLERRPTKQDQERVRTLLEEVGLEKRIHHKIHQLSGGEMQRVAIARALVHSPNILLADEPTGNLDSAIGTGILELLRSTSQNRKMTVIMVTHDRQAASFGGRLVRLKDGAIVGDERLKNTNELGSEVRP